MERAASRRAPVVSLGLLAGLSAACVTLPPRSRPPSPDAFVLEHVPVRSFEEDRCGPGSLAVVLNALGDPVTEAELSAALPRTPGGGVLSVDLLLAARQRGFAASLVAGDEDTVRGEIREGRPVILLLRLLDAPGRRRDIFHYVVADGIDPSRGLLRFQFGDGKARWTSLDGLDRAWRGAGRALLTVRPPEGHRELQEAVELERAGRYEEAVDRYRAIVRGHPRWVRAWVNLGNAEAGRGRSAEAETAYRQALQIAPEDPDALNNLAWLLLQDGERLEEAEELARRALAGSGGDRALVLDTLARIQGARGRCGDAAAAYAEALGLPDLPPARRARLEEARDALARSCAPRP